MKMFCTYMHPRWLLRAAKRLSSDRGVLGGVVTGISFAVVCCVEVPGIKLSGF